MNYPVTEDLPLDLTSLIDAEPTIIQPLHIWIRFFNRPTNHRCKGTIRHQGNKPTNPSVKIHKRCCKTATPDRSNTSLLSTYWAQTQLQLSKTGQALAAERLQIASNKRSGKYIPTRLTTNSLGQHQECSRPLQAQQAVDSLRRQLEQQTKVKLDGQC